MPKQRTAWPIMGLRILVLPTNEEGGPHSITKTKNKKTQNRKNVGHVNSCLTLTKSYPGPQLTYLESPPLLKPEIL